MAVNALATLTRTCQEFTQLVCPLRKGFRGDVYRFDISRTFIQARHSVLRHPDKIGRGVYILLHGLGQLLSGLRHRRRPQESDASRTLRHPPRCRSQWFHAGRVAILRISRSPRQTKTLIPGFEKPFIGIQTLLPQPVSVLSGCLVLYLLANGLSILVGSDLRRSCSDNSPQHGAGQAEDRSHECNP